MCDRDRCDERRHCPLISSHCYTSMELEIDKLVLILSMFAIAFITFMSLGRVLRPVLCNRRVL